MAVGKQFFAHYPNYDTISRCAVMVDFGEQNAAVLKMWEDLKSDPLPLWGIILLIGEVALVVFFVVFYLVRRRKELTRRRHRKTV
jgi:hypothetical protein